MCRVDQEALIPQLDANLVGRNRLHPTLYAEMKSWGHVDEHDGMDPNPDDVYFAVSRWGGAPGF